VTRVLPQALQQGSGLDLDLTERKSSKNGDNKLISLGQH